MLGLTDDFSGREIADKIIARSAKAASHGTTAHRRDTYINARRILRTVMQARLDRTVMRGEKVLAPIAAQSRKTANLVPARTGWVDGRRMGLLMGQTAFHGSCRSAEDSACLNPRNAPVDSKGVMTCVSLWEPLYSKPSIRFRNNMKNFVLLAIIGSLLGSVAIAQQSKSVIPDRGEVSRKGDMARLEEQKKKERFKAADEDGNGVLSREEVAKHFPYIEKIFDKLDTDKDGVLSWEEFSARSK